ncbi:uncharacterized protein LOC134535881 isoform X2 [Bacillus rossius redtenbacheri]|uniref:uncharacterized protein LOC134535881 isoform X2 n=1 Tax=Bacillus rossius redtenbacheri TaxID=93214 RepID=UPI002FDC8BDE
MYALTSSPRPRARCSSADTLSSCSSASSVGSCDSQSWPHDLAPLAVFSLASAPRPPAGLAALDPQLRAGVALRSEEKGVLFPWVHFNNIHDTPRNYQLPKMYQDHILSNGSILQQGLYREVRGIVPENDMPQIPDNHTSYIVMGFKSAEKGFNQVMLDTWKDWTGARHVYMYLPDELGLSRISLFHRESPDDVSLFKYIVLVECRNVVTSHQQMMLLDFVQRLRVERVTGYLSVYSPQLL